MTDCDDPIVHGRMCPQDREPLKLKRINMMVPYSPVHFQALSFARDLETE